MGRSSENENKKSVAVSITKDLRYYIYQKLVGESVLENELLSILSGEEQQTIVLRAEKSVPIDNVVKVMDIANRNKFKVILAVKPSGN